MKKKLQIGVIGPAGPQEYPKGKAPNRRVYTMAEEVGYLLAKKGAIVVTGGKSGIMESAARGAKRARGTTVGVVKGAKRFTSNASTDIEVISGMTADGFDEFLLVTMCDGLILLGGGAGTLEEITIAYRNKKPIVAISDTGGWADKISNSYIDDRNTVFVSSVDSAKDAVTEIFNRIHRTDPS